MAPTARAGAILQIINEQTKGGFNGNRGKGLDPPLPGALNITCTYLQTNLVAYNNYIFPSDLGWCSCEMMHLRGWVLMVLCIISIRQWTTILSIFSG